MLSQTLAVRSLAVGLIFACSCSAAAADGPAKSAISATPAVSATSAKPAASALPTPPLPSGPQIIILKLDDVVSIAPGWNRFIDYCEKNHVKAGLGIICESLEKDNQPYFDWLKATQKKGFIEFWCHGYASAKDFYTTHTLEEQTAALSRCQTLSKEKLGFPLTAFGPHYSSTTLDTEKAIQAVPEFKFWLYGPKKPQFYTRLSLPRVMGLEYKVFMVDFDIFKGAYEKYGFKEKAMVLQGHANAWSPKCFEEFTKIVDFLKSKKAVFMTPTEYLNFVNKGK